MGFYFRFYIYYIWGSTRPSGPMMRGGFGAFGSILEVIGCQGFFLFSSAVCDYFHPWTHSNLPRSVSISISVYGFVGFCTENDIPHCDISIH